MTESRALAKVESAQLATASPVFTHDQEQMIRDSFMNGANPKEAQVLLEIARTRRLNPLLKQVHFVKRWSGKEKKDIWSVQVSIDGLRAIAERTGKYDGQDEAEFGPVNEHGYPQWARVKVYRKDWTRPSVGTAYWEEYVQEYENKPTKFWNDMPRVMLAKCAESIAMRKAFPEDMSGLYTAEELGQADNDRPPQLGPHSPHDDGLPPSDTLDWEVAEDLLARMQSAKDMIPAVDSYDKALALRELLGTSGKQSQLTKDVQAAKEARAIMPEQHKELSKIWQHCNRQCAKLEKDLAPGVDDAFSDPPDDPAEDFVR